MKIVLNQVEQKQLQKYEKQNKHLFVFSLIQIIMIIGVWVFIALNPAVVNQFLFDSGDEGRAAIERLNKIVPQSAQEAYLRDLAKDLIPMPIAGVKTIFISITLTWLFVGGLCMLGFSRYQRKQLSFFKEIIDK